MKFIFTADWHIKFGQKNVPIEWQKQRFISLVEQLHSICAEKEIHNIVIGGDLFDKTPTLDELVFTVNLLKDLSESECPINVIIYDGNHEALKKNTTFLTEFAKLFDSRNSIFIIDDYINNDDYGIGADFIPYCRLDHYVKTPAIHNAAHQKILCTHVRGEIPPHVKPEVDLNLFKGWELVLAGDLHSHENSQLNIVYPGSPVTTSFHRNEVTTGVLVVDSETAKWEFVKLELPQLIRKTVKAGDPMPKTDFHHTIYEVEGNLEELKKVDTSNALLDKKISNVERSVEIMQFEDSMSIGDELASYLKNVLNLPEDSVARLIQRFNDYI